MAFRRVGLAVGMMLTLGMFAGSFGPVRVQALQDSPSWSDEGDQIESRLGTSVSSVGDVNGDDYDDVAVGIPYYDTGQTEYGNEGTVYVYYGSAAGLPLDPSWVSTSPNPTFWSYYGYSVSSAGDVNADGFDDLVVGAPLYKEQGASIKGGGFLFFGSAAGLSSTPGWSVKNFYDLFGWSVSGAGDVNDDGFDDTLIGAPSAFGLFPNENHAYAFYGSPSGPSSLPDWVVAGDQFNDELGHAVSGAGDVDGDGFDDVLIGVPEHGSLAGRVLGFFGSASGLPTNPDWIGEVIGSNRFGWSVSSARDVNGDGFDDILVGERLGSHPEQHEGRVYAYYGSAIGLPQDPDWQTEVDQSDAEFGTSVSDSGDVNGDGFDDVILGAPQWDGEDLDEGIAEVFNGSPSGLSASPCWAEEGHSGPAWFGFSVSSAGDTDGDGYDDAILGAPLSSNPQQAEGMAFLYRGGPDPQVSGTVWNDADQDGLRDAGEGGIWSVTVSLYRLGGTQIATTKTGYDGVYHIAGLCPGSYAVVETNPYGWVSTTPDEVEIAVSQENLVVDFGDYSPEGRNDPSYAVSAGVAGGGEVDVFVGQSAELCFQVTNSGAAASQARFLAPTATVRNDLALGFAPLAEAAWQVFSRQGILITAGTTIGMITQEPHGRFDPSGVTTFLMSTWPLPETVFLEGGGMLFVCFEVIGLNSGSSEVELFLRSSEDNPGVQSGIALSSIVDKKNLWMDNSTGLWYPAHNSYDPWDDDLARGHWWRQFSWSRESNPGQSGYAKDTWLVRVHA